MGSVRDADEGGSIRRGEGSGRGAGETAPAAVLFDLDGVLIDSYEVWFELTNAAALDLGYGPLSRDTFAVGWGQGLEADCDTFFPRHPAQEVERYYLAHLHEHLASLTVSPYASVVFTALRARGIPSAVVTNSLTPIAHEMVERAGATPDVVVGANDVARAKPAPDMVELACARLGVPVHATWMVGDSRFDRDAARAAGAVFVGLGTEGDLTLDRLDELVVHLPPARESRSRGREGGGRRRGG